MPEKRYFVKLFGLFVIGILSLILAGIIFFFLMPLLIPLAILLSLGVIALLLFVLLWVFIYFMMFLATALYYLSKPMQVKQAGSYTIKRAKEAGLRQKGRSKRK